MVILLSFNLYNPYSTKMNHLEKIFETNRFNEWSMTHEF